MKKKIAIVFAAALAFAGCSDSTGAPETPSAETEASPEEKVPPKESTDSGSGDAGTVSSVNVEPIDAPMPDVPEGLNEFYTQEVEWTKCEKNECATFIAPMDYADPTGETIEIAVERRAADGDAIGSLLVNPGGPGVSGKDLASMASMFFGEDILQNFDIVGFDPRGVGESTAVDCLDDAALSEYLDASYPDTAEGDKQATADAKELADGCQEKSGKLLEFVGTKYAAQDMDMLRHALGDPKLYYVGYSYGTSLGGQYAELFPENVGRLVLDGAVDISVPSFEQNVQQLKGFELALNAYLDDCLGKDTCPFTGTKDEAREQILTMLNDALDKPIPTSDPDRPLTQSGLIFGIITPLYDDASWPLLTNAFKNVIENNDGSMFQFLFDTYSSRKPNGDFESNQVEANWAINCADTPDADRVPLTEDQEKELVKEAPLFGAVESGGASVCGQWPVPAGDIAEKYVAKGSDPIVVVGTTGDPATPYEWSKAFADQLDNAVLVTWEGEGHTAYGRANDCLNKPIDEYLLNGTVPEDGLICSAK